MGLKLRYNLFYEVEADAVYAALESYWTERGRQIQTTVRRDEYVLYHSEHGWMLLEWDGGWEWELRRAAQLHVSRVLGCAGLLVFVYDGDYWGYELFNHGREVDHFVQDPESTGWFPGSSCSGQPELFAAQFPPGRLRPADIAPYLLPMPEYHEDPQWDSSGMSPHVPAISSLVATSTRSSTSFECSVWGSSSATTAISDGWWPCRHHSGGCSGSSPPISHSCVGAPTSEH
jgi:hypothetical protein